MKDSEGEPRGRTRGLIGPTLCLAALAAADVASGRPSARSCEDGHPHRHGMAQGIRRDAGDASRADSDGLTVTSVLFDAHQIGRHQTSISDHSSKQSAAA